MQKISTVALSVQKLGWGGNFYPPPIPLAYIKKPIPNRVKGDRVLNSKFLPKMGVWEWGNFGSQKVRSAINGTIFNRSASNLVCTHYYLVSTPAKLKNSLWNRFGPLFGY